MRYLISVHIEGCLEDFSVSDYLNVICNDGSALSNCGIMTHASVMCGHIQSFWKFLDRGFQVHGCALVVRPSSHRM